MKNNQFTSYCANCRKGFAKLSRILLVERELGRPFCCEQCIEEYFAPIVDALKEEHLKMRSRDDIQTVDSKKFEEWRSKTLTDAQELWVDQAESGDVYFTFIRPFRDGEQNMTCVAIVLMLDHEPSYVLLDFVTKDDELVQRYRKSKEVDLKKENPMPGLEPEEIPEREIAAALMHESLKEEKRDENVDTQFRLWLENRFLESRQQGDIEIDQFDAYEQFVQNTLEDPDEIWTFTNEAESIYYTFTAHFAGDERHPFHMLVICTPKVLEGGETAMELVLAIPTRDPAIVARFKLGVNTLKKEIGFGQKNRFAA